METSTVDLPSMTIMKMFSGPPPVGSQLRKLIVAPAGVSSFSAADQPFDFTPPKGHGSSEIHNTASSFNHVADNFKTHPNMLAVVRTAALWIEKDRRWWASNCRKDIALHQPGVPGCLAFEALAKLPPMQLGGCLERLSDIPQCSANVIHADHNLISPRTTTKIRPKGK